MTITGYICCCNAIKLDYCVDLAARSLMPIVDELILCDRNSTDGTTELLKSLCKEHQNGRYLNFDKPIPVDDKFWFADWLNWVRGHAKSEMQITLDADEILDNSPECYAEIKSTTNALEFHRLNFWKDEFHLIPEDHVCGSYVTRLSPVGIYMPDDAQFPRDSTIRGMKRRVPSARIFHVGFLRRLNSYVDKCIVNHTAWFGSVDERVIKAGQTGTKISDVDWGWNAPLQSYSGSYPPGVLEWIHERIK